jgi:7,8-dihydropterin-6-yl-methyl-4-(beta-D-ribofuranosyl)aminobenzene 5'-phosphate synthase
MNIKIVYDNQERYGFQHGWGFSVLVNDSLLFDMGEKPESIRDNLAAFGVELSQIREVALSHEDWDHVGGLELLADMPEVVSIYVPEAFSEEIRDKIRTLRPGIEIVDVGKDAIKMKPGAIMTPQLTGGRKRKKEISLVLKTGKGVVLITGCAHPGLSRIIKQAKKIGELQAVIGGFHGFWNLKALRGVKLIVPTHCTKRKTAILARYPTQARAGAAGMELDLSAL